MYCVYRPLWNHIHRIRVAVRETVRSRSIGRTTFSPLPMLAMTLLLVGPGHQAQAATITNTNGDLSPGSIRAAAASGEQFQSYHDLGTGATITLEGLLTYSLGSATAWEFTGNTTSLTVGGDDITADSHLYFSLLDGSKSLTINSDITFSSTADIAHVNGGAVTFNGDVSDISVNSGGPWAATARSIASLLRTVLSGQIFSDRHFLINQ